MHILEIPSFFPPYGGEFCLEQSKALQQLGHEVRILSRVQLGITKENLKGLSRETVIKQRVNQNVFRNMVLNNYDFRCAITGINVPELPIASHIIPWAENEENRLNPENGICLSPLYDKAFDKGFIGISPEYRVLISKDLKEYTFIFANYPNPRIAVFLFEDNYLVKLRKANLYLPS